MTAGDPGLNALDWMNRRALVDAGFAEAVVESPVGPQTYFAGGAGEPLVLLHGAGDHAATWVRIVPGLAALGRYRLVLPDLAGHGASAPLDQPLGMDTLLAGLKAVMEEAVAGRAILTGNSLGAWVAMVWTGLHPGCVTRIIAVDGGALHGRRPGVTLTPSSREEALRLWKALVDEANWNAADFVLDELIRKGREGAIARIRLEDMAPYLMDGRLGELATPVDLIWGESDRLLPIQYGERMARELPRARLTTIPRCGHVPQMECPEQFLGTLRGILDRPL